MFFENLRRAGLLLEFSTEQWEAYARKHFGPEATFAFSPGPEDVGWKDRHCCERGNYIEPNYYISENL